MGKTIKVLQINAWFGKLASELENLIKEEDPDIIFMQEATRLYNMSKVGGIFLTVSDIKLSGGYPYLFYTDSFRYKFMSGQASMGNCIFSRYKLHNQYEEFVTEQKFQDNFTFDIDGKYNVRNFQSASIVVNGKKITLINHHGYHVKEHKFGNAQTIRQMKIIYDHASEIDGSVIFCGDLNLRPDSPSLALFNRDYTNHVVDAGHKTTRTDQSPKDEVCDYIYTRGLTVEDFYLSGRVASDHSALVAIVSI